MSSGVQIGTAISAILSVGVAVNMLALQPPAPGKSGRAAAAVMVGELERRSIPREPAPPPARDSRPADGGPATPETVRAIQRELQARGYEVGAIDGVPGLVTRAAIMAFEHDHGLPLTADPSDRILAAVVLGSAGRADREHAAAGSRPHIEPLVRTVQQSLASLGYAVGRTEGRLNDETVRAIRDFEAAQGLPVSGRISGQLVARLARSTPGGRLASGR